MPAAYLGNDPGRPVEREQGKEENQKEGLVKGDTASGYHSSAPQGIPLRDHVGPNARKEEAGVLPSVPPHTGWGPRHRARGQGELHTQELLIKATSHPRGPGAVGRAAKCPPRSSEHLLPWAHHIPVHLILVSG